MTVTANPAAAGNHSSAAASNGAMDVWIRSSMSVPVRADAVMICGCGEVSSVARDGSASSALGLLGHAGIGQEYGPPTPGRQGDGVSSDRRQVRQNMAVTCGCGTPRHVFQPAITQLTGKFDSMYPGNEEAGGDRAPCDEFIDLVGELVVECSVGNLSDAEKELGNRFDSAAR
ncbi:hypothetical protein [Rhodococcus jostii]|uniref:hypothetical protein n=1 Tax=Rhodococcus jostii TaxID=132919 RepID=UPI00157DC7F1|nr:hypothetical protein [Rhodococcus jostii]